MANEQLETTQGFVELLQNSKLIYVLGVLFSLMAASSGVTFKVIEETRIKPLLERINHLTDERNELKSEIKDLKDELKEFRKKFSSYQLVEGVAKSNNDNSNDSSNTTSEIKLHRINSAVEVGFVSKKSTHHEFQFVWNFSNCNQSNVYLATLGSDGYYYLMHPYRFPLKIMDERIISLKNSEVKIDYVEFVMFALPSTVEMPLPDINPSAWTYSSGIFEKIIKDYGCEVAKVKPSWIVKVST